LRPRPRRIGGRRTETSWGKSAGNRRLPREAAVVSTARSAKVPAILARVGEKHRNQLLAAFPIDLIEAAEKRAVQVEHAWTAPASINGTTSSEREAGSQAICPGKWCASGTSTTSARAAAVPHTPCPTGMRTQAGLP